MSDPFQLTDGALLLSLSNAEALDLATALAADPPLGFLEAVPGAASLLVLFEPDRFDPMSLGRLRGHANRPPPRTVTLRAAYDGADLAALAVETGIAAPDLIRLHTEGEHTVAFLGFAPGFAYLSGAPRALAVPRLKTPRVRVPAGSLAVADGYSGIYPAETPGGWRLIGRVADRMFDPTASPPALLRPGDRVTFESVPPGELRAEAPRVPAASRRPPVLRILSPGPFTSVQGGPRHGLAASGVPAGGAMDLVSLTEANAALGNSPLVAGLECTVAGPELEALVPVRICFQGEVRALRVGECFKSGSVTRGIRGYVAIEGGLAQPLPGELTRPLRRGEELFTPNELERAPRVEAVGTGVFPPRWGPPAADAVEVRAMPGPQLAYFRNPERFFTHEYQLSPQSDRRGLRLQGPALELLRADIPPEGTAPGAVQVPGDGMPIVLGPDRPVTGGYPKIATVISADLPLLAQLRPGARIRFREVGLADALATRQGVPTR